MGVPCSASGFDPSKRTRHRPCSWRGACKGSGGNSLTHSRGVRHLRCLQWRVEVLEDGKVAIQNPANLFPSRSLSYEGEAERGKRVIPGPVSDFPTHFWRVEPAPQRPLPIPYLSVCNRSTLLIKLTFGTGSIRALDKDLIVVVSGLLIFPPIVCYSHISPHGSDLLSAGA